MLGGPWDWAQLSQFHAPPVWGCQPLWEPLAQPKAKQGVGRSRPPSCLPRFDPANTNVQDLKLACCLPLAASFGTSLASLCDTNYHRGAGVAMPEGSCLRSVTQLSCLGIWNSPHGV